MRHVRIFVRERFFSYFFAARPPYLSIICKSIRFQNASADKRKGFFILFIITWGQNSVNSFFSNNLYFYKKDD